MPKKKEKEPTYCGIKKVPKSQRASAEYCISKNQVRYYGLKKIDKDKLEKKKAKSNFLKEQMKYRKLLDDAKLLVKDVKNIDLQLELAERESKKKTLRKQKEKLLEKRDRLVKSIKAQKEKVDALQED